MGVYIVEEANRCLNCKKPMCQQGCPVQTPIPAIIQLFKENRLPEAGELLFENNPMSVVCAKVCNHEAQCTGHCVLGKTGNPVRFYEIEEFISDAYLDRMPVPVVELKKERVAVIGCGPAGMTVAILLARQGYQVTIFDEKDKIGGMLQYGIPAFRLPKTILERYKVQLLRMGIQIRPNTVLGGELTIEDLQRDGYASIFAGTGTWRPKSLGIVGESLANVHYGLSYLVNPSAYDLGQEVAIIGMGNVAMDVARTALRNGALKVTLYARSRQVSATENEVEYAKLDGAEFVYGMAVDHITPEGPVFKKAIMDEDGNVTGYEEEMIQVKADSTIIAASQGPKNKLVLTTEGLKVNERGLLVVDENMMTTCDGVFAGGDVVHGSMTVVHAVEEAKRAAAAMMEYMAKKA